MHNQPYPIFTSAKKNIVNAYPSPVANKEDSDEIVVKLPPSSQNASPIQPQTPNSSALDNGEAAFSSATASLMQLTNSISSPNSSSLFAPLQNSELFGSPAIGFDYGFSLPLDTTFDPQSLFRSANENCGPSFPSDGASPSAAALAQAAASMSADFYLPEFHEYSRQQYELSTNPMLRKRMRMSQAGESENLDEVEIDDQKAMEIRRQIHIQSEQKRRAQIKDGFEDLRKHLPNCINKKISKAAILNKTVLYLQQLKASHFALAQELERLQSENERLRQFQEQVLQKQALDKIYSIGM